MEITFRLTPDALAKLQAYYQKRHTNMLNWVPAVLVVIVVAISIATNFLPHAGQPHVNRLATLASMLVPIAIFIAFWVLVVTGRSKSKATWMILIVIIMALITVATQLQPHSARHGNSSHNWLMEYLSMLLPIAVFIFFWLFIIKVARRNSSRADNDPFYTEPHTIRLTPEHLFHRDGTGEGITYWHTLHEVGDDNEYIYLFVSPTTAHIVPKNSFPTNEQATQFLLRAQNYWQAAKLGNQPIVVEEPLPRP